MLRLAVFALIFVGFTGHAQTALNQKIFNLFCGKLLAKGLSDPRSGKVNARSLRALTGESNTETQDRRFAIVPPHSRGLLSFLRRAETQYLSTRFDGRDSLPWYGAAYNLLAEEEGWSPIQAPENGAQAIDRLAVAQRDLNSSAPGPSLVLQGDQAIREGFLAKLNETQPRTPNRWLSRIGRRFTNGSLESALEAFLGGAATLVGTGSVFAMVGGPIHEAMAHAPLKPFDGSLASNLIAVPPIVASVGVCVYRYFYWHPLSSCEDFYESARVGRSIDLAKPVTRFLDKALTDGNRDAFLQWGITKVNSRGLPEGMTNLTFRWDPEERDFVLLLHAIENSELLQKSANGTW